MRRIRHLGRLLRDLGEMSSHVGALWLVPVAIVLLVTAVLVATAHSAVPYVVYTFF